MPPRGRAKHAAKIELALLLTVLDGPVAGQAIVVQKSPAFVGRKRGNAVWLKDEFVSEQHAELSFKDGDWYIAELGSSNGTTVNGQCLTADDGPRKLQHGDEVLFGNESHTLVELDRDTAPVRQVLLADGLKQGLQHKAARDKAQAVLEEQLAALAAEHGFALGDAVAAAQSRHPELREALAAIV